MRLQLRELLHSPFHLPNRFPSSELKGLLECPGSLGYCNLSERNVIFNVHRADLCRGIKGLSKFKLGETIRVYNMLILTKARIYHSQGNDHGCMNLNKGNENSIFKFYVAKNNLKFRGTRKIRIVFYFAHAHKKNQG